MNTQQWDTWKPEIDAYIQDETAGQPESAYRKLFEVKTTDRLKITENTWSGFGPMMEVGEMGDAVEDEAIPGYQTNYSRQAYRKSARFSSDLMETDQSGEVERIARDLARVPEYSRNLWTFSMFRRAWDTLRPLGDGSPLIGTARVRKDGGGTQNNTFADGVQRTLSYDAVKLLEDQLYAQLSNSGNLLSVGDENKKKVILTSYMNRLEAFKIADVSSEPDTADRNDNYFVKGANYDVLISKYLSYEAAVQAGETTVAKSAAANIWDTMWFILDMDLAKRYFRMFVAEGYSKFDDELIKSNQVLVKYAYDKFAYGATAHFPIVGSKGNSEDLIA